ncbi:FecR family protein [Chitinophaga sp. RAB17]|uniref:FecR family protein n=1 Tax=Chitinophaga sp. RAB17 TaxID=3233049 RepID=UPI003F939471
MSKFHSLLERYLNGDLSDNELLELQQMLPMHLEELTATVTGDLESGRFDGLTDADQRHSMYIKIMEHPQYQSKKKGSVHLLQRLLAAACVIILIATAGWLVHQRNHAIEKREIVAVKQPVSTTGKNAILTLADGTPIKLDSIQNGLLARQGNSLVLKQKNGQLAYNSSGKPTTEIVYNTVSTPKGVMYTIILPDSSEATLNAFSSIRFPTSFTGSKRTVEITGEVYFKVHKNSMAPFIVKLHQAEVQVLGTSFNINGYEDEEALKVTLLEGAVRVGTGTETISLKPRQQARITRNGTSILNEVDVEDILSWQKGFFLFKGQTLPEIMRQVSRWYDVEITYEGPVTEKHFTGIVSRTEDISEILKFMQLAGIKFRNNGKKITVIQ